MDNVCQNCHHFVCTGGVFDGRACSRHTVCAGVVLCVLTDINRLVELLWLRLMFYCEGLVVGNSFLQVWERSETGKAELL